MAEDITNLEELLEQISRIKPQSGRVSLEEIIDHIGNRSFGPLLLMTGVSLASPLSGIPGMSTTMGIFVLLIVLQMPFRRNGFWLPGLLRRLSVPQDKLDKALRWLQKPARGVDRLLKPRLVFLVSGPGTYIIAMICAMLALFMPVMEFAPFSASAAGTVLAAYGLALIARDGALAVFAFVLTIVTVVIIVKAIF